MDIKQQCVLKNDVCNPNELKQVHEDTKECARSTEQYQLLLKVNQEKQQKYYKPQKKILNFRKARKRHMDTYLLHP